MNRSNARWLNEHETPCRLRGRICWVGIESVYCTPCFVQGRGKVKPEDRKVTAEVRERPEGE